jgi:hypothetical protein
MLKQSTCCHTWRCCSDTSVQLLLGVAALLLLLVLVLVLLPNL